jgi:hypothetical protein
MGDEPAQFKTIRLCSIKAAQSNTIAVMINRISWFAGALAQPPKPAAQIGVADAHAGGKADIQSQKT